MNSEGRIDPDLAFAGELELAGAIAEALTPDRRAAARTAALEARVLAALDPVPAIVRAGEGAYWPLLPGVAIKPLRIDRAAGTQTSLWRLAPGAKVPAHDHRGEEECLIVEGEIDFAGERYGSGDYLLAPAALHHSTFGTSTGALLLIRSELTPHLDALFERAGF